MNQPKVHTDRDNPPSAGARPEMGNDPETVHGIPEGAGEAEPKATPTSGRHETETQPVKDQPAG